MAANEFIFHGARRPLHYYVQADGSLCLKPSSFFEVTKAVCFTPFEGIARDYASRGEAHSPHRDTLKGCVFRISAAALRHLKPLSEWEFIVETGQPIVVPAGQWSVLPLRPIKELLDEAVQNGISSAEEHLQTLLPHERSDLSRAHELDEILSELEDYQSGPRYENENLIQRIADAPALRHNGSIYTLEGLNGKCTRDGFPCAIDELFDAVQSEIVRLTPVDVHHACGQDYEPKTRVGNYRTELHLESGQNKIQVKARYDYDLANRRFAIHFSEKIGQAFQLTGYALQDSFPFQPKDCSDPDQARATIHRVTEVLVRAFANARLNGRNPAWLALGEDPQRPEPRPTYRLENGRILITDPKLKNAVDHVKKALTKQQAAPIAIHRAAKTFGINEAQIAHALALSANTRKKREPLSVRLERGVAQIHKLMSGASQPEGFGTKDEPQLPPLLRLEAEEAVRINSDNAELARELLATLKAAREIAADHRNKELELRLQ